MPAVVKLVDSLAVYKRVHDEVESGIVSIPPKLRELTVEHKEQQNLPIANLVKYGELFCRQVGKKLSRSVDELLSDLRDELEMQQEALQFSSGADFAKFRLNLDYSSGGNSSLGVAVMTVKKETQSTVNVCTALFAEMWVEQSNVRLEQKMVQGAWDDQKLEMFLLYRLISKIPKSALSIQDAAHT